MRYIICLGLAIILLYACSSSAGILAEKDYEREYGEKNLSKQPQSAMTIKSGLNIETDPIDALIYINNLFYGTSPFNITDLDFGRYLITIKKKGYHPYTIWITYSEKQRYYKFLLEPVIGIIDLKVNPAEAAIKLGNKEIAAGITQVPAGSYVLHVYCFGYKEYTAEVFVKENETTAMAIDLESAPLAVTDLYASRNVFNPRSLSFFGMVHISFQVSARGRGEAVIYNDQGQSVYRQAFPEFLSWMQSFTWRGKDAAGNVLPDGMYTIEVTVFGDGQKQAQSGKITLAIDSTLDLSYRNLWSGTSGLLYVPTTDVLPPWSMQVEALFISYLVPGKAIDTLTVPSALSLRLGLPLDAELDGSVKLIIKNMEENPLFAASLAYKMQLLNTASDPSFSTGFFVKFTYQHDYTLDPYADYSGATIGVPLQLKTGPFSLLLAAEVIFSWLEVAGYSSAEVDYGLKTWLYTRAGIFYDNANISGGFSFSVRTKPFEEGFAFDLPFQAALEINALLPGTPFYVSGQVGLEWENLDLYSILGGFGFGFLW